MEVIKEIKAGRLTGIIEVSDESSSPEEDLTRTERWFPWVFGVLFLSLLLSSF